MTTQAQKLKNLINANINKKKAHFIAITSGKGGVGKSTISANLANVLSLNGYKVALLDADIGLANLDVILNVKMGKNLLNVLKGECKLDEILIPINKNLILIPGESGSEILKFNSWFLYERFLYEISELKKLDFMIIDTGAGIGENTQMFLQASDEIVILSTPDPASIMDAYAMIKVISRFKKDQYLLMNMTKNEAEAVRIFKNIKKVADINLNAELKFLGHLNIEKIISKSVRQRKLFTNETLFNTSNSQIKVIASNLLYYLNQKAPDEFRAIKS